MPESPDTEGRSSELTFAQRLEVELQHFGITQLAVAQRLGISQGTVSGWFNRGYVPQPRNLFDLAEMLGVRPEWLLEGKEPKLNERSQKVGEQVLSTLPRAQIKGFSAGPSEREASERIAEQRPNVVPYSKGVRMIPLLSWAQAGQATDFEEMPEHWLDMIPAAVTDKQAFAVQLRGDSMYPPHSDGDVAICLPSTASRHGDLVVANIKDHGVVFKILNLVGGDPNKIRLKSYNPAYDPMEFSRDDFNWMFPVLSVTKFTRR